MSWNEVSYVVASKTRHAIMLQLDTHKTPTLLANILNINLPTVSRALAELHNTKMVVCMTPHQRDGRIYSLTKKGKDIKLSVKTMKGS